MIKLIKIPKCTSIFLDEKYLGKFQTKIDRFLVNTKNYLESVHDKSKPHNFEIKSGEIRYSDTDSNDTLTYLH